MHYRVYFRADIFEYVEISRLYNSLIGMYNMCLYINKTVWHFLTIKHLVQVYGFENRKTVKPYAKKFTVLKMKTVSKNIYGFENRKQKNLRF